MITPKIAFEAEAGETKISISVDNNEKVKATFKNTITVLEEIVDAMKKYSKTI